jgi:pimeloyl-ACP methyl ester carboxylesterase
MPFVDNQGILIHYQHEKPARPEKKGVLTLIHGITGDLRFWNYVVPYLLEEGYEVIRYDLRGHGKSSSPKSGYSIKRRIEDLKALLDSLGLEKTILIGHSLGGGEVLNFAIAYPERLTALCLIDTYVSGFRPRPESPVLFNGPKIAKEESVAKALEGFRNTGIMEFFSNAEELNKLNLTMHGDHPGGFWLDDGTIKDPPFKTIEKIKELKGLPILCLIGEYDYPDFQDMTTLIKTTLPAITVKKVSGTKHMGPMDKPREFKKLIFQFITTL